MTDEARARIDAAVRDGSTTLSLDRCGLEALPESLRELSGLTALSVSNNLLTALPDWLGGLTSLTSLNVLGNRLESVPDALDGLDELTTLYLGGNRLSSVPGWLGDHTALTYLSLGNNQLTAVPESLGRLTGLAYLSLVNNKLTALPKALGNLTSLDTLTVGANALHTVPEWFRNLVNLRTLSLNRTRLTDLPIWLGELTELTYLHIGANRLAVLPGSLADLRNLTTLYMGDNLLGALPEWLAGLTGLTVLTVNNNRLTTLPEWLGDLTGLTSLTVADNQLTELPETMSRLQSLTTLDLDNNQLTALPPWLGGLPALEKLSTGGNLLTDPPTEIRATGTEAVLAFLRAKQAGSARQWKSKLLIVGEGGVGKTSLIKALEGIDHDPAEPTTHGMRISQLRLDHPQEPDVQMSLAAWDFGGQEIYHATHQFFLTDQSLFLLAWNPRGGYEHSKVRYWLDIITARAPQAPILLVATHGDEPRPTDLPLFQLQQDYPAVAGSFTVDSESRTGIDGLLREVATQASTLPLMGIQWPTTWTAAAELFADGAQTHATAREMRRLMAQAGIPDPADQTSLAQILHRLGAILYHAEDETLADVVILKPEWLSTHIGTMLDSRQVADQNGLLTKDDRDREWDTVEPAMRDHFLDMMERYDLAYRITDPARTAIAIVVDRLSHTPPDYGALWAEPLTQPGNSEIRVRYDFATMPPGIPTWFIAREHRFTTDTHWRSGALLRDRGGEHLALLNADRERKTVELTVRGPMPAGFFAILDDGLNLTLDRYPGLSVTRRVPCPCQGPRGCPEYYDYATLLRRRNAGKTDAECSKTFETVPLQTLLTGMAPTKRDTATLTLDDIRQVIAADRVATSELSQREAIKFLRGLQKAHCPSVFTVIPTDKWRPGKTIHILRLYCEEPGSWHPLADDEGCYEITELSKWLRKTAPYIQRTLAILGRTVPVAGAVLGVAAHELNGQFKDDLEKTRKLISHHIPTHLDALDNPDPLAELAPIDPQAPLARAESDAEMRVLEAMLISLDATRHWGGLNRELTPEGLSLYLCGEHAENYR